MIGLTKTWFNDNLTRFALNNFEYLGMQFQNHFQRYTKSIHTHFFAIISDNLNFGGKENYEIPCYDFKKSTLFNAKSLKAKRKKRKKEKFNTIFICSFKVIIK